MNESTDSYLWLMTSGTVQLVGSATHYIDNIEVNGGTLRGGSANLNMFESFMIQSGHVNLQESSVYLYAFGLIHNGGTFDLDNATIQFDGAYVQLNGGKFEADHGSFVFNGSTVTAEVQLGQGSNLPNIQFIKSASWLTIKGLTAGLTATINGDLEFTDYKATGDRGVTYSPLVLDNASLTYANGSALVYARSLGAPKVGVEWPNGAVPKVELKAGIVTLSTTKTDVDTLVRVNGSLSGTVSYRTSGSHLEYAPTIAQNMVIGSEWPISGSPASVKITITGYELSASSSRTIAKDFNLVSGTLNLTGNPLYVTGSQSGSVISGAGSLASGTNLVIGNGTGSNYTQRIQGSLVLRDVSINKQGSQAADSNDVKLDGTFTLRDGATLFIQSGALHLNGNAINHSGSTNLNNDGLIYTGGSTILGFSGLDLADGGIVFNGSVEDEHLPTNISIGYLEIDNSNGAQADYGELIVIDSLKLTSGILGTDSDRIITLKEHAVTVGSFSVSNKVEGPLRKIFASTGSFTFPIGNSERYRPATFTYHTLSGSDSSVVEVEYSTSVFSQGLMPEGVSSVRTSEHYTLKEVGLAPSAFTYSLSAQYEDQNFVPETRNRLVVQTSSTPTWLVGTTDPDTDINTTDNTVQITGMSVFPTDDGIIAFGKGKQEVIFTATQDFDWWKSTNWNTGTLPTAVDDIVIPDGTTLLLGDNDSNSSTETPMQEIASLVISPNSELIIESTNTAPVALLIGSGVGTDTVLVVDTAAVLTINGGAFRSVAIKNGSEVMKIKGTVTHKGGTGFGTGSGGVQLPTSRQFWMDGSTFNYESDGSNFQVQSYGHLNLRPTAPMVINESITIKNNFHVDSGEVTFVDGNASGKLLEIMGNFRVNGTATFVTGADQATDNEMRVWGNVKQEPDAHFVNGNTVVHLPSNSYQETCESFKEVSKFKLSGEGEKKILCVVTVTDELEINDAVINTNGQELVLGTGIDNPGRLIINKSLAKTAKTSYDQILAPKKGGVKGKLRIWIPADTISNVHFPIVYEGERRDVVLSFTQASSGGQVSVEFKPENPHKTGLPVYDADSALIENIDETGYWSIHALAGLTGGEYTVQLFASDYIGVSAPNELRVLKRPDQNEPWSILGEHQDGFISSEGEIVSKRAKLSGFSDFIIGGTSENPLPVELSSFTVQLNLNKLPEIKWETATERENYGFEVHRKLEQDVNWQLVEFVEGNGTTTEKQQYSLLDGGIQQAGTYTYKLVQIDFDGAKSEFGPVELLVEKPQKTGITQVYPNPFNPTTTVSYSVASDGFIQMTLFDLLGRQVVQLVREHQKAGTYSVPLNASSYASGVYFIWMETGGITDVQRITLIK